MSKLERFHIEGDKAGSKNGWRFVNPNGSIVEGSWKTGDKKITDVGRFMSKFDFAQKKYNDEQAIFKKENQFLKMEKQLESARFSINHPYFISKNLDKTLVRISQDHAALLPIMSITSGALMSSQSISTFGGKIFFPGLPVKGGVHIINRDKTTRIYLCEGVATGYTIAKVTDNKYCVICALSAMNLVFVAKEIKQSNVIIAADNDQAGIYFAQKAAAETGYKIVMPPKAGYDFNDLYIKHGLDLTRNILLT